MRRDGGSVFTVHARSGDPNNPLEAWQLMRNVCALISMVARITARSNQRPDALMHDRKTDRSTRSLAKHGCTIHWVNGGGAVND
jgi:hypothetical protein